MSLNGLDDTQVKAAHEAAVAEPGGWFLLKYASRDEVELLGRGSGGIVEIRDSIAQYDEKSPLYGFLRYRRRSVLIKYLPEDCSRLIQARVTVHFEAVCDRFSPYDTTFEISESKELKDTKLSAACSLHAASGSTSSSTSSVRRRRLVEIAEEEEEDERERKRQSVVKEDERPKSPAIQISETPVKLDADLARLPEASRFANELEPPHFMGITRPSSPAKSFDETSRRMSSQSSRTDIYPMSTYPYSKPRVKLGPRPSADPVGRPHSSAGRTTHRPVATVPAGLKSLSRGSRKGRSQSRDQDDEAPESPVKEQGEIMLPPLETVHVETTPIDSEGSPQPADSQIPSISAPKAAIQAPAQPANKENTVTPEKARLLKAMKLREQKKMMSLQPAPDVTAGDIPSTPSTPGLSEEKQGPEAVVESGDTPSEDVRPQGDLAAATPDPEVDVATDRASVDTCTDSHPSSPAANSDIGDSTQASSVSESTDETILAKDEDPDRHEQSEPSDNTSLQSEAPPSEASTSAGDSGLRDRYSQATITPGDERGTAVDMASAAPEDDGDQPTKLEAPSEYPAPETSPIPTSSEAPAAPSASEKDSSEAASMATVDDPGLAPAASAIEISDADSTQQETTAPSQVRIPVSKFSTQETKSPLGSAIPAAAEIVANTPDADAWRVAAPPVPEKDDDDPATGEVTEVESKSRHLPEPIRTDLNVPDHDKRCSVISILDNDGFIEELQSATAQQATPVTVSKSPISPMFSGDENSKAVAGESENSEAGPRFSRTVSNPVRNSFLAPGEASAAPVRSASSGAAYLQKAPQQPASTDLRPKSSKLGSSISQRIKALEKLSGSTPPSGDATPKERPAATFFAVRKTTPRETSRPSSVVDMAVPLVGGVTPSPPASRDSSPETTKALGRGRSGSLVNRMSMFEGGMRPRGRPESVQVTARIVRDPSQPFPKAPELKGGSPEYAPLDLKQSPLLVDVHNRVDSRSPVRPPSVTSVRTTEQELAVQAKQTLLERRQSKHSQEGEKGGAKGEAADGLRPRRRSSLSAVKDFIKDRTDSIMGAKSPSTSTDNLGNFLSSAPTGVASPTTSRSPSRPPSVHQAGSLARRLSISSRRSSIDQNSSSAVLSPPRTLTVGPEPEVEAKNGGGPASPNQGKTSRASRFIRRLSNTLATGRKNGAPSISPTVAEENAAEVEAASRGSTATSSVGQAPPSIVAFMGDVNVQFPDNLLWKRRSICLDSQGFLILSAVQGTATLPTGKDRQGVKRFHMSDFKAPYAPDVELQELPNSVVLDLVGGSGLQIACEDRAGQMSILQILEEAHHNHSSFGQ